MYPVVSPFPFNSGQKVAYDPSPRESVGELTDITEDFCLFDIALLW